MILQTFCSLFFSDLNKSFRKLFLCLLFDLTKTTPHRTANPTGFFFKYVLTLLISLLEGCHLFDNLSIIISSCFNPHIFSQCVLLNLFRCSLKLSCTGCFRPNYNHPFANCGKVRFSTFLTHVRLEILMVVPLSLQIFISSFLFRLISF